MLFPMSKWQFKVKSCWSYHSWTLGPSPPCVISVGCYLPVQRVLGGQFVLQFVVEVVNVRGLPLSSQVAFLQCCYPLLQILPLWERDRNNISQRHKFYPLCRSDSFQKLFKGPVLKNSFSHVKGGLWWMMRENGSLFQDVGTIMGAEVTGLCPPHLSLFPLLFDWQLLTAAQLPACVGEFGFELGDTNAQRGRGLAALAQFLIGAIQDLLKLRHPATVVVGIYGAVGQSLPIRHIITNVCTCFFFIRTYWDTQKSACCVVELIKLDDPDKNFWVLCTRALPCWCFCVQLKVHLIPAP